MFAKYSFQFFEISVQFFSITLGVLGITGVPILIISHAQAVIIIYVPKLDKSRYQYF